MRWRAAVVVGVCGLAVGCTQFPRSSYVRPRGGAEGAVARFPAAVTVARVNAFFPQRLNSEMDHSGGNTSSPPQRAVPELEAVPG